MDDPAEEELAGAAENIDVLVEHEKVQPRVFYTPPQSWSAPGCMASGQADYLAQASPGQVGPPACGSCPRSCG